MKIPFRATGLILLAGCALLAYAAQNPGGRLLDAASRAGRLKGCTGGGPRIGLLLTGLLDRGGKADVTDLDSRRAKARVLEDGKAPGRTWREG
jgi:hypothetical protein